MQQQIITVDEIKAGLPESMRPFLEVMALPLPRTHESIIRAFWLAAESINGKIKTPKRVSVVFATSPFDLKISNGQLIFHMSDGAINAYVEDMVFIDCNKMYRYTDFPIQVACILEELVHVLMNVTDEELVKHIVCQLYAGVKFENGQLCLR